MTAFGLIAVDGPPARPERTGVAGPGRPSPLAPILDQVRAQGGGGQWFRVTGEPLDVDTSTKKALSTAGRIRAGKLAGIEGGEFDAREGTEATGDYGHLYVSYVGAEGIREFAAQSERRAASKAAREAKKAAKAAAVAGEVAAAAEAVSAVASGEASTANDW